MINSRTKLFGVIGDPIAHSLSPILQNYLMRRFKIDAVYLAFRVTPQNLAACVQGAWAMGFSGLNVTLPHKEAIAGLSKFRSPEVNLLGVANTLVMRDQGPAAFVTDPPGFIESLGAESERFVDARIVLFGAGGSARSICYAVSKLGAMRLTIVNRTPERALNLLRFCQENLGLRELDTYQPTHPDLDAVIDRADILINATSMGMHPYSDLCPLPQFSAISAKHFVYDLIYNPGWTRLLDEAEKRGAKVKNGLDMLIFQGLESLRIWTNERLALERTRLNELRSQLALELK